MSKFVTLFIKQLKVQKKTSMLKQQGQICYQNKQETFKTQLCQNDKTTKLQNITLKKGQFVKGSRSTYTIYFKYISDPGNISENLWEHRTRGHPPNRSKEIQEPIT